MKPVLRQAIEESGVPMKAVADAIGRGYSYTADCVNDSRAQELTSSDLVKFMRATNLTPLRWLCSEFNGSFLPHLQVPAGCEDIRDRFMRAVEEVGRDSAAIQRALADGQMTDSEGRDLVAELENTIVVFREVMALVATMTRPQAARMTLPAVPAVALEQRA